MSELALQRLIDQPASSLHVDPDRMYRLLVGRDFSSAISLDEFEIDRSLLKLLPTDAWHVHLAVPLVAIERRLVVAMPEMCDFEPFLRQFCAEHCEFEVQIIEVAREACERALARL